MIAIMSSVGIQRLLSLSGSHLALLPGQTLFCAGDAVRNLYIVVDGLVRLVSHQANGAVVVLQRAHVGELLAEDSLFASRYHCDAVAEPPALTPEQRTFTLIGSGHWQKRG